MTARPRARASRLRRLVVRCWLLLCARPSAWRQRRLDNLTALWRAAHRHACDVATYHRTAH